MLGRHLLEFFQTNLKFRIPFNIHSSYSVVEEKQLFEKLDVAAKEDKVIPVTLNIADLFGSWSNQKGFPLLHVHRNDNGSLTLMQEKYDEFYRANNDSWWIPYNFDTSKSVAFNATSASGWLPKNITSHVLELDETDKLSNNDWVLFNRQQTGYYRVLYTESNYNLLINQLKSDFQKIHRINRAQIIDDLLVFARSDRVPTKLIYNILNYLKNEVDYAPWQAARRAINDLKNILAASEMLSKFQSIVTSVVEPLYNNISIEIPETESFLNKFTRNIAVNLACEFSVKSCLNATYTKLNAFVNGTALSQHNRGLVFANGLRTMNEPLADKLWDYFLNSNSTDERAEIIVSFANIPNNTVVERYLNKSIEDFGNKTFSKTERLAIITSVMNQNQNGVSLVIALLHRNVVNVNDKVGSLTNILKSLAERIITTEINDEVTMLYN